MTIRFPILAIGCLLLTAIASCQRSGNKSTLTEEREEQLYNLVYEPGARGDYAEAIRLSDSLLNKKVELSDSLRAYLLIEKVVALMNSGQITEATLCADTLISFGQSIKMDEAYLQGLQVKGLAYKRKQMYDSAIYFYNKALEHSLAVKDLEQEQAVAELLSVTYAESGRNDESIQLSRRAFDLARQMDDTIAMLQSVGTLAAAIGKTGDMKLVVDELHQHTNLIEVAAPTHIVKFYTPLLHAYIALDSLPKAGKVMAIIDSATSLLPQNNIQHAITAFTKSRLAKSEGDYATELKLLRSLDTLPQFGQKPEARFSTEATCLAHLGHYEEAYACLSKAFEALDSARTTDVDRQLSELSTRYDTLTKEIEIERLSRQRWIMVTISVVCLALFAAILAFWLARRASYRRRLEYERRLQYVRGLEQERARVARELHDDIAGSLIGLQWEMTSLSTEEACRKVYEVGQRVRRLSHEMLPPEFAKQSLPTLLSDFVKVFNSTHADIRICLTDEGTFDWNGLNAEAARELYRIVQETVNNILKHSKSTYIAITLDGTNRFILSITNNGCQAETELSDGGGEKTLLARARLLGAEVTRNIEQGTYTLTVKQS